MVKMTYLAIVVTGKRGRIAKVVRLRQAAEEERVYLVRQREIEAKQPPPFCRSGNLKIEMPPGISAPALKASGYSHKKSSVIVTSRIWRLSGSKTRILT